MDVSRWEEREMNRQNLLMLHVAYVTLTNLLNICCPGIVSRYAAQYEGSSQTAWMWCPNQHPQ
jgi:hypothetical protein